MKLLSSKRFSFQKEMRMLLPLKSKLDSILRLPCAFSCSPEGIDAPWLWFQGITI